MDHDSSLIDLEIVDLAFGGKGVGRHSGKVVFVPFVLSGEEVRVRLVREKKKFSEAALVEVAKASPDRVEAPCPYFGQCGGCSYQHVLYERQIELKQRQVEATLKRLGTLKQVPMRPMIASPQAYGYRNRLRVHARAGKIGFYGWDCMELVDIERCLISSEAVNANLKKLRQRKVRDGDYTVAEEGSAAFFEQTNPPVGKLLLELVGRLVSPDTRSVVDAYCGSGAFAKHLVGRCERVIGIEGNASAVAAARKNATEWEEYRCGPVEQLLATALKDLDPDVSSLVLDPPAPGLSSHSLDGILAGNPREVIYVSCNPATLARDLSRLTPVYTLLSVTPLDMFPQTAEIEVVAHLRR